MGKHKNKCWACQEKHYPPTGKNCQRVRSETDAEESSGSTAGVKSKKERDSLSDSVMSSKKAVFTCKKSLVNRELYSSVKRVSTPGKNARSDTDKEENRAGEACTPDGVQLQILKELQKVNTRLDIVEGRVAEVTSSSRKGKQKGQKLSTVCKVKRNYSKDVDSDVSSDTSEMSDGDISLPDLAHIRTSKQIQKQIDKSRNGEGWLRY